MKWLAARTTSRPGLALESRELEPTYPAPTLPGDAAARSEVWDVLARGAWLEEIAIAAKCPAWGLEDAELDDIVLGLQRALRELITFIHAHVEFREVAR